MTRRMLEVRYSDCVVYDAGPLPRPDTPGGKRYPFELMTEPMHAMLLPPPPGPFAPNVVHRANQWGKKRGRKFRLTQFGDRFAIVRVQ